MKLKRIFIFLLAVSCLLLTTACITGTSSSQQCVHAWQDATCNAPKTCSLCGETEGSALHCWLSATCTQGKTCLLCGTVDGAPLGHRGGSATDCQTKAVCDDCGVEYGDFNQNVHAGNEVWFKHLNDHSKGYDCCGQITFEPEQHVKVGGICSICGFDPTFSCLEAEISEDGNTAVVYVSVSDNPGIVGLQLTVSFDDSITLIDAESCSALAALSFTKPTDFSNGGMFVWDGVSIEDKDVRNGEVIKLTFDISNASIGDLGIILKVKACDNNLQALSFKIENGVITITH